MPKRDCVVKADGKIGYLYISEYFAARNAGHRRSNIRSLSKNLLSIIFDSPRSHIGIASD